MSKTPWHNPIFFPFDLNFLAILPKFSKLYYFIIYNLKEFVSEKSATIELPDNGLPSSEIK